MRNCAYVTREARVAVGKSHNSQHLFICPVKPVPSVVSVRVFGKCGIGAAGARSCAHGRYGRDHWTRVDAPL